MSDARADEVHSRIEQAAFNDGRALRDLRDSLPSDPGLTDDERAELSGRCDTYLNDMATVGFEGEPAGVPDGDD